MSHPLPRDFDERDRRIQETLLRVPVPEGAKARVRARLGLAEENTHEFQSEAELQPTYDGTVAQPSRSVLSQCSVAPNLVSALPEVEEPARGKLSPRPNSYKINVLIVAAAACMLLMIGWQYLTRPVSLQKLVGRLTDQIESGLSTEAHWQLPNNDSLLRLLRIAGFAQMPISVEHMHFSDTTIGSGMLWRFAFADNQLLYLFEASSDKGYDELGHRMRGLDVSLNSWALAGFYDDGSVVIVMTQGDLKRYLQLPQSA